MRERGRERGGRRSALKIKVKHSRQALVKVHGGMVKAQIGFKRVIKS